jgi:hypothetical protein
MVAVVAEAQIERRSRFHVSMAGIFAVIAFGGFVPTYWSKIATGTFNGAPIAHLHGMLFFSWTVFFFVQTWFVASGRTLSHRSWGMAGISLATAMSFSVVLLALHAVDLADAAGAGDAARRFLIVTISGLLFFVGFFTLAIVYVKQPEVHKRLMLLTMITLLPAAAARVFLTLFAGDGASAVPPVFVSVPPALLIDLLVVAAIVHDVRTRGRPHPVYIYGGTALLAVELLNVPLSNTHAWLSFAKAFQSLGG